MTSWAAFAAEAPELAERVHVRFTSAKHCTLATLRRDGSPRISGTEVGFTDGEVWLGSMPRALKALDLRRDPRCALHSPSVDPPSDNPSAWVGEAKMAGRAVEVGEVSAPGQAHRFRLDLSEVVLTRMEVGALLIESWHPQRGLESHRR